MAAVCEKLWPVQRSRYRHWNDLPHSSNWWGFLAAQGFPPHCLIPLCVALWSKPEIRKPKLAHQIVLLTEAQIMLHHHFRSVNLEPMTHHCITTLDVNQTTEANDFSPCKASVEVSELARMSRQFCACSAVSWSPSKTSVFTCCSSSSLVHTETHLCRISMISFISFLLFSDLGMTPRGTWWEKDKWVRDEVKAH